MALVEAIPPGWFQVAWSDDLEIGAAVPLRYFDRDLVLYRGESGRAMVGYAFCPHMGAHLGFGGTMVEDDIVCPFHGWRWAPEGANVEIPYSKKPNPRLKLQHLNVHEAGGVIWAWFHPEENSPQWDAPATEGEWQARPFSADSSVRELAIGVTTVAEAIADAQFIGNVLNRNTTVTIDGSDNSPRFVATHRIIDSRQETEDLSLELWGLGSLTIRSSVTPAILLQTHTPIDDRRVHIRISVAGDQSGGNTASSTWTGFLDAALPIWEHLDQDVAAPPDAKEESIAQFRRWVDALCRLQVARSVPQ